MLVSAALVTVVVAVARSSAPPTLVPGLRDERPNPATGISGGSIPMRSSVSAIELGTFLCATRDVQITSVSLYKPSPGIVLTRWGFKNNNDGKTDDAEAADSLARLGPFTSHTITEHCGATDYYAHLGLELHRTRPGTQAFLGLRMTYQSDDKEKVAYLWEQYELTQPHIP